MQQTQKMQQSRAACVRLRPKTARCFRKSCIVLVLFASINHCAAHYLDTIKCNTLQAVLTLQKRAVASRSPPPPLPLRAQTKPLPYRLILIWVHAVLWPSCRCRRRSVVAGAADENNGGAEKQSSPCLLTNSLSDMSLWQSR